MAEVCAFFDEVEDDGWARVTRMHHQPAKLAAELAQIEHGLALPDTDPEAIPRHKRAEARALPLRRDAPARSSRPCMSGGSWS